MPFIEYVQSIPHEDQPLNSNSMFALKGQCVKSTFAAEEEILKGKGVVVGIGDNGDVQTHIDFTGRLINRAAQIIRAHATHVTGTIGGAGLLQELLYRLCS